MIKVTKPMEPEVTETYCDGCKSLMEIYGLPEDQLPIFDKKPSVALSANFSTNCKYDALYFNVHLCNECGEKVIDFLKQTFNLEILSDFEGGE
jgi:hypothetical protein